MAPASGQGLDRLSVAQRALLARWLPDARITADLGWGGAMESFVLEAVDGATRLIVKAGGPSNHHIARELDAHDGWIDVWARHGVATSLVHASRDERIFVAERVPGDLVDGTDAAVDPRVHRRAGELLRVFHDQAARSGDERLIERIGRALAGAHRIPASTVAAVRRLVDSLDPESVDLVPAHGDWQPRNWLIDGGELRIIDFGRFSFRSRASDLVRLDAQQWRESPECEEAFLAGYGYDPREGARDHWTALRTLEAVGTAAWAYQMGDDEFEAQGHRMIAELEMT